MLSRLQELQKLCQVGMSAWQAAMQTVVPALHVVGCPGTSVAELPPDVLEQAVGKPEPSEVPLELVQARSVQRLKAWLV